VFSAVQWILAGTTACSFFALLFYSSYRFFPSTQITTRSVSLSEKRSGTGVLLALTVQYEAVGKPRCCRLVFSGSVRQYEKLHTEASRLKKQYEEGRAKYHHLPGLTGVGVLEGSVTFAQLAAGAILTGMLAALFVVTTFSG